MIASSAQVLRADDPAGPGVELSRVSELAITTTAPVNGGKGRFPVGWIRGLPVSAATKDDVLNEMARTIDARERGHFICVANTESMYLGTRHNEHRDYIRASDFSICDGVGVIVAGLPWGYAGPLLTGPDLMLLVSKAGAARGWRHFFYGGATPDVAVNLERKLKALDPAMIVCGSYVPPFRELSPEEDARVIDEINAARPDIVWCGLGLPKQERWIAGHLRALDASWLIGVGAAFDFHSGRFPMAPRILKALGLGWLFYLVREPRRRAARYLRALIFVLETFFLGLVSLQFLRKIGLRKLR
jgi:N-acetylglucosaminyldiphosphoundecaprenol N-acetyl-beta-D-mannosaminyltransferase